MNLHDLILVKCLTQKKCLKIQRLLFSSHLYHTFTGQSTRYSWEPKRVHPSPQPHCSPRTLQASQTAFFGFFDVVTVCSYACDCPSYSSFCPENSPFFFYTILINSSYFGQLSLSPESFSWLLSFNLVSLLSAVIKLSSFMALMSVCNLLYDTRGQASFLFFS